MSEFERLDSSQTRPELHHPLGCFCVSCCRWYASAPKLAGGRCRRCHEPIDRHALVRVVQRHCPATPEAAAAEPQAPPPVV